MSVKIDVAQLSKVAEGIRKKLHQKALNNLLIVFEKKLIPRIAANLMQIYDKELSANEPGYDPARPSKARDEFSALIQGDLKRTLKRDGNSVALSAGALNILKYDKAGDPTYVKDVPKSPSVFDWLIFYLEGFVGEYAFITEETYKKFFERKRVTKKALEKFSTWGWYGEGFMIPRKVYIKQRLDQVVSFDKVKHPFSGLKPTKLFERALDGIDMRVVFTEVFKKTIGK